MSRPRGDRTATRRAAYRRGLAAETVAAWWYRLSGHRILAVRHRTPLGEIDLVARRGSLLVFVEVKARADVLAGREAVTRAASRRILAAADLFVGRHPRLAACDRRFDVAVVRPWRPPVVLKGAFDADI